MGNVAPAAAENSTKLGDLAVHHPPHFHADRRVALRSFPDIDYLFEAPTCPSNTRNRKAQTFVSV